MEDDSTKNTALGIIGFIIFVVLVLVAINSIIKPATISKEKVEEQYPYTYIDIKPRSDYPLPNLNYSIYDKDLIVQEGIIESNIIERIRNLDNKSNYTIVLDHPDFYKTEKICNPKERQCYIFIDKIGKIQIHFLKIKDDFYRIILFIEDGILKEPKICIADNSIAIKNLRLVNDKDQEFYQVPIEGRHKLYYDKCYKLISEEDMKILILRDLREKYDIDIKKYNKEHKTSYKNFNEIKTKDEDYINYPVEMLKEGFHEYNLFLDLNGRIIEEEDSIKIMVLDVEAQPEEKSLNIS